MQQAELYCLPSLPIKRAFRVLHVSGRCIRVEQRTTRFRGLARIIFRKIENPINKNRWACNVTKHLLICLLGIWTPEVLKAHSDCSTNFTQVENKSQFVRSAGFSQKRILKSSANLAKNGWAKLKARNKASRQKSNFEIFWREASLRAFSFAQPFLANFKWATKIW